MVGIRIWLRFEAELNDFLPLDKRQVTFEQTVGPTDTVKYVIESLQVPHTEVGAVILNNGPGDLSHPLTNDRVQVFPHPTPILLHGSPSFVIDGHLGCLAAYLRMLGFDV